MSSANFPSNFYKFLMMASVVGKVRGRFNNSGHIFMTDGDISLCSLSTIHIQVWQIVFFCVLCPPVSNNDVHMCTLSNIHFLV